MGYRVHKSRLLLTKAAFSPQPLNFGTGLLHYNSQFPIFHLQFPLNSYAKNSNDITTPSVDSSGISPDG